MKKSKRMSVETFDEYFDSGLITLKYHYFAYMVEDIRKYGTLSVSESSPYDHCIVHMKKAYNEFCWEDAHK